METLSPLAIAFEEFREYAGDGSLHEFEMILAKNNVDPADSAAEAARLGEVPNLVKALKLAGRGGRQYDTNPDDYDWAAKLMVQGLRTRALERALTAAKLRISQFDERQNVRVNAMWHDFLATIIERSLHSPE